MPIEVKKNFWYGRMNFRNANGEIKRIAGVEKCIPPKMLAIETVISQFKIFSSILFFSSYSASVFALIFSAIFAIRVIYNFL